MTKVIFQDEEGQNLNRYLITPTDGSAPFTADLVRAANITKQGTPYNKEVGDHFLQVEDGTPVRGLACATVGTVHALTGLTAASGLVSCVFKADADYAAGDTFTVDGTAYMLKTRDGSALTTGAWAAGAIITGTADADNTTLYVEPSTPTALKSPAALTITNGPGNTPASYDGSAAKTVQVPYFTVHSSEPGTVHNGELWGVY